MSVLCGMQPFEKLQAWQAAHRLYIKIYQVSESWPRHERYGLTAQIRSAALSVGSNLAEGVVKRSPREFAQCIEIALGSLSELCCQLMAARDVSILPEEDYRALDIERETASKLAWQLYRAVKRRSAHALEGG